MKIKNYLITLKQPVIISETTSSIGAHQSLDYIRGSAILGLVASQLYNELEPKDAFLLFHSGKVRFNDALPMDKDFNQIAYPVPMSLHSFKAEKYVSEDLLLSNKIFDIAKVNDSSDLKHKQPVQLRGFYITANGKRISPLKENTLKTAIDPYSNRAKDSQLFGYEALSANQKFSFSIQADDEVSDELWEQLTSKVVGKAHLGRSRSAQFGAVEISENSIEVTKPSSQMGEELTLWLISDLQLHINGQPTLIPEPELLGLPEGTVWKVESSFLRSRAYSMYNAYRRHYDKERQVISRGSVLRYQLPAGFNDFEALQIKLSQGVGLQIEAGLGQIWVNPTILSETHPTWQESKSSINMASQSHIIEPRSNSRLIISALLKKQQRAEIGSQPRQIATDIFNELCKKITQARRYQGLVKGMSLIPAAPSRTQFGRFKEMANQYRNDPNGLWHALAISENAMLKIKTETADDNRQSGASYKNAGWELKYEPKTESSLGQFLQNQLEQYKTKDFFAYILAELAILGLSDTWEDFCIGNKSTVGEQNQQNIQNEEQAS